MLFTGAESRTSNFSWENQQEPGSGLGPQCKIYIVTFDDSLINLITLFISSTLFCLKQHLVSSKSLSIYVFKNLNISATEINPLCIF